MDEKTASLIAMIGVACLIGLNNRKLRRHNTEIYEVFERAQNLTRYFADVIDNRDVELDEFDLIIMNDIIS